MCISSSYVHTSRASIFIDIAAATAIASFVSLTSQLEALQLHSTDDNDTTTTTTTTTHEDVNVRLAHVHQQLRVAQADLARVARCKRELTMMMALRQRQKANKAKVRDAGREDGTEKTKKKKRKLGNESDPDQTLETRTTTTDTTRQKKDFDLTAAKRFIRSALQATLGPLRRKKSQDARKKVKPQAMDGAVKEEGGTVQKKRKKE